MTFDRTTDTVDILGNEQAVLRQTKVIFKRLDKYLLCIRCLFVPCTLYLGNFDGKRGQGSHKERNERIRRQEDPSHSDNLAETSLYVGIVKIILEVMTST